MIRTDDTAKAPFQPECALEALPYGVWVADATRPNTPIVYCNPAVEQITGYAPDEMLGRSWRILEGPETDITSVGQVQQAIQDGQESRIILKNHRKDGSPFWNELTLKPTRDARGKLTHWVGTLSDVSGFERLKAAYAREQRIAQTLQENELQLADLLESITEGFFALDGQWRFTYVNQQAEPLLGQPRQELLGQDFWETFPALRYGALHGDFRRAVLERVPVELTEYVSPRAAWWNIRASPTPEGLTVFLRDVSEHQREEEEKRHLLAQQRVFLRDVLASVTGGKLRLCYAADELPAPLMPLDDPVPLSGEDGLLSLRHLADRAALAAGFTEEQRCDLDLSAGEAAMNAVVHAGTGTGTVSLSDSGTVQVRIEDHGAGITVENLPKATLERGFTTAGTMGYGMKIMLEALDRLWLLTSSAGTTVVMEKDLVPPEHDPTASGHS